MEDVSGGTVNISPTPIDINPKITTNYNTPVVENIRDFIMFVVIENYLPSFARSNL
jgi:hypothetical protein